ncbi:MAG: site-specific DNA-methyltransferase [Kiritimatiellae bacterium]|nr:site-specific DNA-methyltransferase [Kiritimatiellia bacterium]
MDASYDNLIMKPINRKNFCGGLAATTLVTRMGNVADAMAGGIVIKDRKMKAVVASDRERYGIMPIEALHNKIICGDSAAVMEKFPDNSIDMVVTSPPYDSIRDYKGFSADLSKIGRETFRVLKEGGIAVVVIQDQTKNYGKTLTSFRLAIDWCDNAGFKLFECLIYKKLGAEGAWWNKRFRVDHEYMMVFLKGDRPAYFNKDPLKIPSKHGGKVMTGGGTRLTSGIRIATRAIHINPMKCRGTVWAYETAGDGSRLKHQHPATYPDRLPYDFIQCFCPEKGIVLDPFMGSGTTALAAKSLKRFYVGIDISQEYVDLAERRVVEDFEAYKRKADEWAKPPAHLPVADGPVRESRNTRKARDDEGEFGQLVFALG